MSDENVDKAGEQMDQKMGEELDVKAGMTGTAGVAIKELDVQAAGRKGVGYLS